MAVCGVANLITRFSAFVIRQIPHNADFATSRLFNTCCSPLYFRLTPVICAEPLKKKKRVDPAILRRREERKRRRLEKDIRRLERNACRLKPIEEAEVPKSLIKDLDKRRREPVQLSFEEAENRAKLQKEWCQYKTQQHVAETDMITRILTSQERALGELRNLSEELYQAAIQVDENLIPFKAQGPVGSPPIKGYEPPAGVYVDTTRKWDKKIELPTLKARKVRHR